MAKDRFTANPFPGLELSAFDTDNILDIVNTVVDSGLQRYENFTFVEEAKVDTTKWKVFKSKENTQVFVEKRQNQRPSSRSESVGTSIAKLPALLSVGTTIGTLEDVMLGVVNPTLESMRVKASYVNDLSAAAVLPNVVMPSEEDPFRSVVVKWMELDIPFQSTGLVQNRDYVYVEATGTTETFDGERVGFHVLHSVDFPQTPSLSNRVRASMSICGFFRQARPNLVSVYVSGIVDPVGNDRVHRLVVSNMASAFLSTLKLQRKLSFIGADLRLAQRKVTFCAICMHNTLKEDAFTVAKRHIRPDTRESDISQLSVRSEMSTVSSQEPPTEEPPRFSYGFVIF